MSKCLMKFATPGERTQKTGVGGDIGQKNPTVSIISQLIPGANCSHFFPIPCPVM